MQKHPLIGDADVQHFTHLRGIEVQHVAHRHDQSLILGKFLEFALCDGDQFIAEY